MPSLVTGLIGIGTIVVGLHGYVFTREEGTELARQFAEFRLEIRDDMKALRDDLRDFTKAAIGKRSASAKSVRQQSKLTLQRPEAQPGSREYYQAQSEARRKAGYDFWLHNFGDDLSIDLKEKSK